MDHESLAESNHFQLIGFGNKNIDEGQSKEEGSARTYTIPPLPP